MSNETPVTPSDDSLGEMLQLEFKNQYGIQQTGRVHEVVRELQSLRASAAKEGEGVPVTEIAAPYIDAMQRHERNEGLVPALMAGAKALEVKTKVRIFRAASNGESGEIDTGAMIDECNRQAQMLRDLASRFTGASTGSAAPGEAKCENDELRKQVAALSKIDEQGMGHDDALSAIAGHVHEIKVLCDAFGYDPSQWLQDEAANGIDCAPSPEQQDKALEWTIHSKYALVAPEQQGAEQYPLNYMQTALAEGSESGMCWISAQVCESVIESLRTAPAPALGLSEKRDLADCISWLAGQSDRANHHTPDIDRHFMKVTLWFLRSLLERGGV
jgi:hypothetical protein